MSQNESSPKLIEPEPVTGACGKCLILRVKKKYYDRIRSGEKRFEYREIKDYWTKRLVGRTYDTVAIANRRNTKLSDPEWLIFPWAGFLVQSVFPDDPAIFRKPSPEVYAIQLLYDVAIDEKQKWPDGRPGTPA